jgi:hypothetical protein
MLTYLLQWLNNLSARRKNSPRQHNDQDFITNNRFVFAQFLVHWSCCLCKREIRDNYWGTIFVFIQIRPDLARAPDLVVLGDERAVSRRDAAHGAVHAGINFTKLLFCRIHFILKFCTQFHPITTDINFSGSKISDLKVFKSPIKVTITNFFAKIMFYPYNLAKTVS